jgi:hypothetical protein
MKRRTLISAVPALALGTALQARAAEGRKFVVMSLVSDKLTMAGASGLMSVENNNRPTGSVARLDSGTLIHRTENRSKALPNAPFDRTAMEVLSGEVPRAIPGAQLIFLAASGSDAYSGQEAWFDGDTLTLPASLRGPLEQQAADATQLLLITKIKRPTRVSDGRQVFGVGVLEGLGVYHDRTVSVHRDEDGLNYALFAPYVYIRLSLVDRATSKVLRYQDIEKARTIYSDSEATTMHALQVALVEALQPATAALLKEA